MHGILHFFKIFQLKKKFMKNINKKFHDALGALATLLLGTHPYEAFEAISMMNVTHENTNKYIYSQALVRSYARPEIIAEGLPMTEPIPLASAMRMSSCPIKVPASVMASSMLANGWYIPSGALFNTPKNPSIALSMIGSARFNIGTTVV